MILPHPERCAGGYDLLIKRFQGAGFEAPRISEYASGHEQMMMLVAAGYGIGLALASQVKTYSHPDVVVRDVWDEMASAATYLVHANRTVSSELERFVLRAKNICKTPK